MNRVLTIAQRKGGAGKTTLAANIAALFAATRRVALLDIDPQRSVSRWHALRAGRAALPSLTLSDVAGWRVGAAVDALRRDHDLVVIDSPPQLDTDARLAIRAASVVLIPVQPSAPDLWACEGTLQLVREERRPARVVLNRVPPTGRDRAAGNLSGLDCMVMDTMLGNRTAFARSFAEGRGATEAEPRSAASAELRALADEIEAVW